MRETFFQICVYFTVILLAVTLCINAISAMDLYGETGHVSSGVDDANYNETELFFGLIRTTEQGGKIENEITEIGMWGIISAGIGVIGVLTVWVTGSTALLAGWIFSAFFWSSWLNLMAMINVGGWIPAPLLFVATALMIPIFIGAVIGLFSGSG